MARLSSTTIAKEDARVPAEDLGSGADAVDRTEEAPPAAPERGAAEPNADRWTTQSKLVLAATIAVLVVPILLDLALAKTGLARRLFAYAAPDTFYYLTVARNIGLHGRFSFDGEHLSNGYHPFWQVLTSLPYALRLPGAGSHWVLAYLIAATIALQTLALGLLARVLRRLDGTLSPLFVFLPAGAYAVCVSPVWLSRSTLELSRQNGMEGAQPVYGTWWSYVNGMETSLVLFFFGVVLWLAVRRRALEHPIWLGLAAAALSLARLDHALIVLPILVGVSIRHLLEPQPLRRRLGYPFIALASFAVPLTIYLVINRVFFGLALPISGALKSSFPGLTADWLNRCFDIFNRTLRHQPVWLDETWRVLQIVVPVFFALVTPLVVVRLRLRRGRLLITWAGPNPALAQVLLMVAAGVLCLALYDVVYVYFYGAGHWYVPISTVFTTLVCFYGAERVRMAWKEWRARRTAPAPVSRKRRIAYGVGVAAAVALSGASFLLFQRCPDYHLRFADFAIDEAPKVRASFAPGELKLIDCDDGIVAWALAAPTMSGTGLGLDIQAARAKIGKGGLLPLALKRGFTHVAALVYVDPRGPRDDEPDHVRDWVAQTGAYTQLGDVKKYKWSVAYRSPKRIFTVVKFAAP